MVKARKYVLTKNFEGLPKRDDFKVVEEELPPIQDGEILVKTEWVSVDPFQRTFNFKYTAPYDQFGFQVGVVVDSKDPQYPVGTRVSTLMGWCDYYVMRPTKPQSDILSYGIRNLPDLKGLPSSLGAGALGMPGAAAYFGFLEICEPKGGETVVVTSAAGAVGSLVGQIAKMKGCKVIGFAGSDVKVQYLEKELGFDKAFNYKTVDVTKALKEAAPNGVDCYFDNVGGEFSTIIINNMNPFGRVAVSGCISAYNQLELYAPKARIVQPSIILNPLKLQGFLVTQWLDRWPEAFAELAEWISSGKLKVREHITEGFDNIYDAFIGMFNGENIGKALVKL